MNQWTSCRTVSCTASSHSLPNTQHWALHWCYISHVCTDGNAESFQVEMKTCCMYRKHLIVIEDQHWSFIQPQLNTTHIMKRNRYSLSTWRFRVSLIKEIIYVGFNLHHPILLLYLSNPAHNNTYQCQGIQSSKSFCHWSHDPLASPVPRHPHLGCYWSFRGRAPRSSAWHHDRTRGSLAWRFWKSKSQRNILTVRP